MVLIPKKNEKKKKKGIFQMALEPVMGIYCDGTTNQLRVSLMMKCFCGMVDRRRAFSLNSSWDLCERSSPLQISDMLQAGFEPVQNLSLGLVE